MNLLTVFFCYITVTCNTQVTPDSDTQRVSNTKRDAASTVAGRKTVRQTISYPTRYDYMDLEAVINNERMMKMLFNCVIGRGRCTREGLELKRVIPDAIQTECAKCNEQQKKQAGKVLAYLLHNKPEYFQMLIKQFDPNNVYLKKYMADDESDQIVSNTNKTNSSITTKN